MTKKLNLEMINPWSEEGTYISGNLAKSDHGPEVEVGEGKKGRKLCQVSRTPTAGVPGLNHYSDFYLYVSGSLVGIYKDGFRKR